MLLDGIAALKRTCFTIIWCENADSKWKIGTFKNFDSHVGKDRDSYEGVQLCKEGLDMVKKMVMDRVGVRRYLLN